MGLHLDLACAKLNYTQVELKNGKETRNLEEKFCTRKIVWKIDEFCRIMSGANKGKKKYIESHAFYYRLS